MPNKRNHTHTSIEDGTVSLCTDMFTDDYREQSYLDAHVSWIDRQFQKHHAALAVRHFGHRGSYWRLAQAVNSMLAKYGIPECGLGWVGSR